jgi:hypothetical protein
MTGEGWAAFSVEVVCLRDGRSMNDSLRSILLSRVELLELAAPESRLVSSFVCSVSASGGANIRMSGMCFARPFAKPAMEPLLVSLHEDRLLKVEGDDRCVWSE